MDFIVFFWLYWNGGMGLSDSVRCGDFLNWFWFVYCFGDMAGGFFKLVLVFGRFRNSCNRVGHGQMGLDLRKWVNGFWFGMVLKWV